MQAILFYMIFVKSQGLFAINLDMLIYNLIAKVFKTLKLTK